MEHSDLRNCLSFRQTKKLCVPKVACKSSRVYEDNSGLVRKVDTYELEMKTMNDVAEKKMKEDIENGIKSVEDL